MKMIFTVPGRPVAKPRARVPKDGPAYYEPRRRGSKLPSYNDYRMWVQFSYLAVGGPKAPDTQGYGLKVSIWAFQLS